MEGTHPIVASRQFPAQHLVLPVLRTQLGKLSFHGPTQPRALLALLEDGLFRLSQFRDGLLAGILVVGERLTEACNLIFPRFCDSELPPQFFYLASQGRNFVVCEVEFQEEGVHALVQVLRGVE